MSNPTLTVDTAVTVLSATHCVYKTERLLKQTALLRHVDAMLDAVAGGALRGLRQLPHTRQGEFISLSTEGNLHVFWVRVTRDALIFCGYDSGMESLWREDNRFVAFLAANPTFTLTVAVGRPAYPETDFDKLYKLSLTDGVYFPCLNPAQRALVELEDANVLVQGVAGSGKTNVCIDKIVFAACRGYGGKVLYTTYSRGLLTDTRMRVERWKDNVKRLATAMATHSVLFLDEDKQTAVANRLGLYLAEDCTPTLATKLQQIVSWLDTHVDYMLVQDIYTAATGQTVHMADEDYFVGTYMGEMRNYYLSGRLDKIKELSQEVIYKEIFGLIEGWCDPQKPTAIIDKEQYTALRQGSFGRSECDTIYGIYQDYARHLTKAGRQDNNTLSRALLGTTLPHYSLVIADEVQDFTQVTLVLLADMCDKMFAVGDALQMINPSYFQFAYLKRLLFDRETARVATLQHNYRSGRRIQEVIEMLGALNEARFGTHNFVLRGTAVGDDGNTNACFVADDGHFAEALQESDLGDVTIIAADRATKQQLRQMFPEYEVLTVSEIKGLERDNVVLWHLIGTNLAQWQALERKSVDRKTADENSVYRYYFNLFYVGVSRARRNLYVLEGQTPLLFDDLLMSLDSRTNKEVVAELHRVAGKKLDEAEQLERVEQFIKLGQYENALSAAAKLPDAGRQTTRIRIYQRYIAEGEYRQAGIAFWQAGLLQDAEQSFVMGNEEALLSLMRGNAAGERTLSVDMLRYYTDLAGNPDAQRLLVEMVQQDLIQLREQRKNIQEHIKKKKK